MFWYKDALLVVKVIEPCHKFENGVVNDKDFNMEAE
jgi:hypothetical protein